MSTYHIPFSKVRFSGAAFFFVAGIILFASCKKDDDSIGLEVQPEGGQIAAFTTDTITIVTETEKEDSLRADGRTINLIGRLIDPVFGFSSAEITTQLRLATLEFDFGTTSNLRVDSLVLSLRYNNAYGDVDAPQSFKVYRINEDLFIDSAYYTNHIFSSGMTLVGEEDNVKINVLDSVDVAGEREPPQLRLRLDNSLGQELIDAGAAVYADNASFQAVFKGLHIESVFNGQGSTGGVVYYDMLDAFSRLTLYYSDTLNDDTLSVQYLINDSCERLTTFNHNFDVGSIATEFDSPTAGDERVYVQSLAGTRARIDFPFIEKLINAGPIIINRAEILLEVDPTSNTTDFPPHDQLFLARITEDGASDFVLDQFEGTDHFGGEYDETNAQYKFNITRHIQSLLKAHQNGVNENFGLYLVPSGSTINANRVIINGPKSSFSPMKLIISYTPI